MRVCACMMCGVCSEKWMFTDCGIYALLMGDHY